MDNMKCQICDSDKIIPNLRIRDRFEMHRSGNLEVVIARNPDAILFKSLHREALRATVCGECGDARLTVDNPQGLWQTYVQSEQSKYEI